MSFMSKKNSPKILTDRLFFHDVINLTHGILLFLTNKKISQKGLEIDELQSLEKEVRTLQAMLKDHFQLNHKNLNDDSEWMYLKEIRPAIDGLLETYLGHKNIPYELNVVHESETHLIYLPAFYRIMNNLIKNMAEASTTHAKVDLIFEKGSLLIETKNKVESAKVDRNARSLEGLGLESIRLLSLEHGGAFSHEMVGNLWCNHIVLPLRDVQTQTKNWASKKVA